MKEQREPMSDIDINRVLHRIASNDKDTSIEHEIALWCTQEIVPAQHLRGLYKDKGLKYSLDDAFFCHHIEDIMKMIQDASDSYDLKLTRKNVATELSFLACQLTIQKLLLSFRSLDEDDIVF